MYEFTKIGIGQTRFTENELCGIMDRMEWKRFGCGDQEGLMQAEGIKAAVKSFRMHGTYYASSSELAPLGLLAVRHQAGDTAQNIYFIDKGDCLVPLAIQEAN